MRVLSSPSLVGGWLCPDCGVETQLPSAETAGVFVQCPDCPAEMVQYREWDERLAG